jgi:threonylcarbamoyladenosine tRNA methylthiotransferase CDKAL1
MAQNNGPLFIGVIGALLGSWLIMRYTRAPSEAKSAPAMDNDSSVSDDELGELEDTVGGVDERLPKGSFVNRVPTQASVLTAFDSRPGTGRIFVRTFGCSHNISDSEFMMGLLVKYGYTLVESLDQSDLCIFNSCTVKNPSQDAAVNLVARADQLGKKIVVTGCVPQAAEEGSIEMFQKASLVGVSNIDSIVKVVEETLQGNRVVMIGKSSDLPDITQMPKIRRNKLVEIIAVSTGCLGQCTYCKTKHARGELGSYPVDSIIMRVKTAVSEGVKQIWLTSEDLGAYGIDIGTDIVALLEAILENIKDSPDVMLRLGMTNPPYMLQHAHDVARILRHPQVFEFLHVPVQSGSDEVLRNMKREYTREDFCALVDILRDEVPHVTIATDIICGFPYEADEDHADSVSLIEKYMFPIINISQFYPRPGTPAARMTKVPTKIVKARSSEITRVFESYTTNEYLLGQVVHVWFDLPDESSMKHKQSVGHTKNYTKVIVPMTEDIGGQQRRVKITSIHKWDVRGEILD